MRVRVRVRVRVCVCACYYWVFTFKKHSNKKVIFSVCHSQGKVKVKKMPLNDWRVKYRDPTDKVNDKAFVVVDGQGNQSKFSAKTPSLAQAWVDKIRLAISLEEERLKREVYIIIYYYIHVYIHVCVESIITDFCRWRPR